MRKFFIPLVWLVFCSGLVSGQVLWVGADAQLQFANADGTLLTKATNGPIEELGLYVQQVIGGQDGNVYGVFQTGGQYYAPGSGVQSGTIIKIAPDGIFKLRDLNNEYIESLGDGEDGFIYGVEVLYGSTRRQLFKVGKDGSNFQRVLLPAMNGFRTTRDLFLASDGWFYGISMGGGDFLKGSIFRFNRSLSSFEVIHSFQGTNGSGPVAGVVEGPDGYLYGVTNKGGVNLKGIVFKVRKDGTDFIKLLDFDGAGNGMFPVGSLIYNPRDGFLYGFTSMGGTHHNGIIFKVRPDGSSFTEVFENGEFCTACSSLTNLLLDDEDFLYSINTYSSYNKYKLKTDGTVVRTDFLQGYSILPSTLVDAAPADLTFSYPQNNSEGIPIQFTAGVTDIPFAALYTVEISESPDFQDAQIFTANTNEVDIEGLQYETTYYARAKTNAWPTYGETITFTTGELPGPVRLWGVTTRSESPCLFGSGGTIFSILPDGTSFVKHVDYDCATEPADNTYFGKRLDRSLHLGPDNRIYGTAITNPITYNHWWEDDGFHFEYADLPPQALGLYYDVIQFLSFGKDGEIFRLDADGNNFTTLYDSLNMHYVTYSTIASNGELYLTSVHDYTDAPRNLLRGFALDGSTSPSQSIVHDFSIIEGDAVRGTPVELDGYLYGTSMTGSSHGRGGIYKVRLDGSDFSVIHAFDDNSGRPRGGLMNGNDGYFYGMDWSFYGKVYRIRPDGSDYSVLHQFSQFRSNGRHPYGALIDVGNVLYGMTPDGGQWNNGVIFSINKDGSDFTIHHSFSGQDGDIPLGDLTFDGDHTLYGMAYAGGTYNLGTIFSINVDGTSFTKLFEFTPETGGRPNGNLLMVGIPSARKASPVPTQVASVEVVTDEITIYPNPSRNAFTLEIKGDLQGVCHADLLDINGRKVSTLNVKSGSTTFGEELAAGIYILRVNRGTTSKVFRVMKK